MTLRPAVFLDRDGTINEEVDYLHKPEQLMLISGAAQAIAKLNVRGIPVIVVTNQSGIGRGYYDWQDFAAVMSAMSTLLAQAKARIDAVYVAPHHEKGLGDYADPDHPDRKPNPGMLQRAAEEHGLDLSRSWMIGDKPIDVEAGKRAGCFTCLVRTGYGAMETQSAADLIAEDLAKAVDRILEAWP
jgi:D-glycero-D-manno-heptose 1,7-bisphosphate phosphatase